MTKLRSTDEEVDEFVDNLIGWFDCGMAQFGGVSPLWMLNNRPEDFTDFMNAVVSNHLNEAKDGEEEAKRD